MRTEDIQSLCCRDGLVEWTWTMLIHYCYFGLKNARQRTKACKDLDGKLGARISHWKCKGSGFASSWITSGLIMCYGMSIDLKFSGRMVNLSNPGASVHGGFAWLYHSLLVFKASAYPIYKPRKMFITHLEANPRTDPR